MSQASLRERGGGCQAYSVHCIVTPIFIAAPPLNASLDLEKHLLGQGPVFYFQFAQEQKRTKMLFIFIYLKIMTEGGDRVNLSGHEFTNYFITSQEVN